MAIHWERGTEPPCRTPPSIHDGLPRPSRRSLLAMTRPWCLGTPRIVIASLKGVAIHWERGTEPSNPNRPSSNLGLPPRAVVLYASIDLTFEGDFSWVSNPDDGARLVVMSAGKTKLVPGMTLKSATGDLVLSSRSDLSLN